MISFYNLIPFLPPSLDKEHLTDEGTNVIWSRPPSSSSSAVV